jgi:hypothetical protein
MEETDRKVIEAAKKGRHFYIRRRADRKEHITAYDPTTHKLQHLGLAGDAAKAVARGEWAPEDAEQSLDSEKKSNQIVHELTRAKDKGLTPSIFGGHVWVGGRKVCGTNAPVFDELEGWIKVEKYVLKLWRHRRPK